MPYSDVTVVGADFFAVSTALLLSEKGYSVILITNGKEPLESFVNTLATMWPSLNDPPTRADVAHGHEVACYLNNFCQLGVNFFYTHFADLIKQTDAWIQAPCLRIGSQTFEQEELEQAKKLGFGLNSTHYKEIYLEKYPSYICTNMNFFKQEIKKVLQSKSVNIIEQKVTLVTEEQNKCLVNLENGTVVSEVLVLGNGAGISSFLPKYDSILVPMSDILCEYYCTTSKKLKPVSLRAASGHVAAVLFFEENRAILKITGPRFLLPQSGADIKLNKADINVEMLEHIKKYQQQFFYFLSLYYNYNSVEEFLKDFPFQLSAYSVEIDCHPCDELPLLGEFGKFGKILGSAGWLATGNSAGVWGAKIITDLICQQKSEALHPRLQPRRFNKITG